MQRTLHLQGMGRHNRDEVYHIGCADITALSVMLGKKAYLFGDQPTSVDASAFGFLHNILHDGMGTPLTKRAESYANLVKYCERINAKYFTASADAAPGRERKSKPRRAAAR
jgi:glutathione S-transferase